MKHTLNTAEQCKTGLQGLKGEQGDKGDKGDTGAAGRGIEDMDIIDGNLWVYYTDGKSENLGSVGGSSGEEEIDISCLEFTLQADDTYSVSVKDDYKSTVENITIPSKFNGKSVTAVANNSFTNCTALKEVNIADGITIIDWNAFAGCTALKTINIPNSVTKIGSNAFAGCDSLETINIPDSVTSIGGSAFFSCDNLTQVNIPDGVESIGRGTFEECDALEVINIPNSITCDSGSCILFL